MEVRLHPHALERLQERGATEEEVRATVEQGEQFPGKFGRTGFRRNFRFDSLWRGNHYHTKQVEAYAVQESGHWLVITVITLLLDICSKGRPMRFTYDPRYNIAYIRFQEKQSTVKSVRVSDELIVDMAPDGTVYGIELLNANEQLRRDTTEKLLVINESTGEHIELPLAVR